MKATKKSFSAALIGALLASPSATAIEINKPQVQRTTPYPGIKLTRTLTYRTYLVSARTFDDWKIRLGNSPIHGAEDAVGLTENSVAYDGQLYADNGLCHPGDLEFTHHIEVTLPDVRIGDLTSQERSGVVMVSNFIADHEQLHVADFIASTDRLLQRTHSMAGTTDCETYKSSIKHALAAESEWTDARSRYVDENSTWDYMVGEINKRLASATP